MNGPVVNPSAAYNVNLRHLNVFLSVAAKGGISSAAESLYRVSSAVTRTISELERSVGVALFDRRPRGVLLNGFGTAVLERTKRIEIEFTALRDELALKGIDRINDPRSLFNVAFNGRRLAVIAGLADGHNMPAIARQFSITQPAVSLAVKAFEARLGTSLFHRSAKGVTPTQIGEIVAFRSKRILAELRHAASDIAALQGTLVGQITVGALPLCRTLILPSAIAALVKRHPQLRVLTVESPYEALVASLRSGDIDVVVGALRPVEGSGDLQQEPLFVDRLSLIVRAGHPIATKKLSFKQLHEASWALSRRGSPARELLEKAFRAAGQPCPFPAVETGDLALLRGLLQESDMVTAISAEQLHYEIKAGSLIELDFALTGTARDIGLAQRAGARASPGTLALLGEIRAVVGRHTPPASIVERAAR